MVVPGKWNVLQITVTDLVGRSDQSRQGGGVGRQNLVRVIKGVKFVLVVGVVRVFRMIRMVHLDEY